MRASCGLGGEHVLYGWGRNAPPVALPPDTGFAVGPGTATRTAVLQVHYLAARPAGDRSGVRLTLSPAATRFSAGVVTFAAGFVVPPRAPAHRVPNRCCYSGFEPLEAFAFRVHTHALGRSVWLDAGAPAAPGARGGGGRGGGGAALARAAVQDPQAPQGFYPLLERLRIRPGDALEATCEFDSSSRDKETPAGHGASAEMCNLYLMLRGELPFFMWCVDDATWAQADGAGGVPPAARLEAAPAGWAPPRFAKASRPSETVPGKVVTDRMPLGQMAGVAASAGALEGPAAADGGAGPLVWALHRASRVWKAHTFDAAHRLAGHAAKAPIPWPVVLRLRRDTGAVAAAFGAGTFYMPHMITEDADGNVWVADVGLHQVLKFSPAGKPLLALGVRFEPGTSPDKFCLPTHVVVGRDGTIYVGDGYCNSRVARFAPDGTPLGAWKLPPAKRAGAPPPLPHSLALDECRRRLYVADREAARVLALDLDAGGAVAAEWDLRGAKHGLPYALRVGPYGAPIVLLWDRDRSGAARVAALGDASGEITGVWDAPGARAPHDLELVPAPLAASGAGERLLAVLVAETAEAGSTLRKYVLRGERHDDAGGGGEEAAAAELPAGLAAAHGAEGAGLRPIGGGGEEGAAAIEEGIAEEDLAAEAAEGAAEAAAERDAAAEGARAAALERAAAAKGAAAAAEEAAAAAEEAAAAAAAADARTAAERAAAAKAALWKARTLPSLRAGRAASPGAPGAAGAGAAAFAGFSIGAGVLGAIGLTAALAATYHAATARRRAGYAAASTAAA
jgi:peptidylamidoglycolate lyase